MYWCVAGVISILVVPLVILISFGFLSLALAPTAAIFASIFLGLLVAVFLVKRVATEAHASEWIVDDGGFQSAAIGRCEFSDVEASFIGLPIYSRITTRLFTQIIARGIDQALEQTIVIRRTDGRLLPINLLSPSYSGGETMMIRLREALIGKMRPSTELTQYEKTALSRLRLNQWINPRRGPHG